MVMAVFGHANLQSLNTMFQGRRRTIGDPCFRQTRVLNEDSNLY